MPDVRLVRSCKHNTLQNPLLRPASSGRSKGFCKCLWDDVAARKALLRGELPPGETLVVLDEI